MTGPFLLAVMGPTGSGKSELAEQIAALYDAQLINADAFQVYRGMDIGTAKPSRPDIYELIDVKQPTEQFGVGEFVGLAHGILDQLYALGRNAVVVGGTGLNVRALFENYSEMSPQPDPEVRAELEARLQAEGLSSLVEELVRASPEVAARIDLQNPIRVTRSLERLMSPAKRLSFDLPPFRKIKLALMPQPGQLEPRLASRVSRMVQNGWIQEVKSLLQAGYGPDDPGFRAIGYRRFAAHLAGNVGLEETVADTIADTRRYAKRQRTWIRSEPNVTLIDPDGVNPLLVAEERIKSLSV